VSLVVIKVTQILMYRLSLALGLYSKQGPEGVPDDYSGNPWPGFGVLLGTNLLGLVLIVTRRDLVWTLASAWVNVSIWTLRPKPAPVYVSLWPRVSSSAHTEHGHLHRLWL
jgi:hypothetical protein